MKATFVYPNSRRELLAGIERGEEPDSQLHGALYLARARDRRRLPRPAPDPARAAGGRSTRVAWNAARADAALRARPHRRRRSRRSPRSCRSPRAARRLPVVVINFGLNLIWRRASRLAARCSALARAAARVICLGESQRGELVDAGRRSSRERVVTMPIPRRRAILRAARGRPTTRGVLTVGKDLARDYATFLDGGRRRSTLEATLVAHPRNLDGVELPANVRSRRRVCRSRSCATLYARRGCVVLPQRGDDLSRSAPRAAASPRCSRRWRWGRPIVASDRAILHDYVDDGVDALLVPPEDPPRCAPRSSACSATPSSRASLGAAARARVERAHTSPSFAAAPRTGAPVRRLGSRADEHVPRRRPLPRAARQPLPPRPAGEVPRLGARRALDRREPDHADGRLPARLRRRLEVAVRDRRPLSALPAHAASRSGRSSRRRCSRRRARCSTTRTSSARRASRASSCRSRSCSRISSASR